MASFSSQQMKQIEIVERAMSVLSLVGSLFIITTFAIFPFFRKPINRLVMFASLGNVLCNIATLISVSGMSYSEPNPLCHFQAFLIQMFIPADSLWTFCMALNVYLTFFKNFNASDLRRLEKWYFVFCYGIPLIPAMIFLILDATADLGIYGHATLWCWISRDWDWMRIAFFYGPVWVTIAATMSIYLRTGKDIFKQRAALRSFSRSPERPISEAAELSVPAENPFKSVGTVRKVTEIQITTEPARSSAEIMKSTYSEADSRSSFSSTRKFAGGATSTNHHGQPSPAHIAGLEEQLPRSVSPPAKNIHDSDPVTLYTTTVTGGLDPRVLMITNPGDDVEAPRQPSQHNPTTSVVYANSAAWGYAKVALLMFLAMFVVWVPSTVNRLFQLVSPEKRNFALNILAAFVLPLQGFWNSMVYIATSWAQCREAFEITCSKCCRVRRDRSSSSPTRLGHHGTQARGGRATYSPEARPAKLQRSDSKDSIGAMSFQEVMALRRDNDFIVDAEGMAIRAAPQPVHGGRAPSP